VIRHDLSPAEVRVLGCLIEKQRTTPDQYPLTRNAMRLACNQSTNRDPVVELDEAAVRAALERLGRNGLVRFTGARGSRVAKYRHLAGEQLGIGDAELAVLALLMLRGPQTPGELRGRGERLHRFAGLGEVEDVLSRLIEAGLVVRFARRPGQKEQRFGHLLASDLNGADDGKEGSEAFASTPDAGATAPESPAADWESPAAGGESPAAERPAADPPAKTDPDASRPGLAARVTALEADLQALRRQLADLLED